MKLNLTCMKQTLTFIACFRTFFISTMVLIMVSGCGGENGLGGAPLGPGDISRQNGSITLSVKNGAGQDISRIPSESVGFAIAYVADPSGRPVPNAFVTFAITKNLLAGSLSPENGFAATDNSGIARVTVFPGSLGESGEIAATTTVVGNAAITDTIAFSS
ncbi:MAG: hypothetical protein K0R08_276 [Solimicrobium sp.]|nr:hypothetical protein [Solimicrobium sp.]